MLIFNDGPPRAGKSYDTVKEHILPALKKGRSVFARLDGLDHAAIATHLGMPELEVRRLLHHVSPANVVGRFRCDWEPTPDFVPTTENPEDAGIYRVPAELVNALVVIDEVHEFYPAELKALDKKVAQFFARHGQFGMDMVLASQTFDQMHSTIRARVERRVLFRKLSHFKALEWLGIGGKNKYSMRFSINNGNGRFKEIGSETRKYDPAIFPLYAGYQPGTENKEVYDGGVKEAGGAGLKFYVPLAIVAALVGVWFVFRFFDPEDSAMLEASKKASSSSSSRQATPNGSAAAAPNLPGVQPAKEFKHPGVAHVMRMVRDHRLRLLGTHVRGDGSKGAFVALVSSQGHNAEVLTLEGLGNLGFQVVHHAFGLTLHAEGETLIVTQWPDDRWGRVSERENEAASGTAGTRPGAATGAGSGDYTAIESPPASVVGT